MAIVISEKSWHYRLNNFFYDSRPPRQLCPYIRRLLITIFILLPILSIIVLAISGMALYPILIMLYGLFTLSNPFIVIWNLMTDTTGLFVSLMFAGVLAYSVMTFFLICKGLTKLCKLMSDNLSVNTNYIEPEEKTISTFGLIGEWLDSVHNKICPSIEFKR